MNQKDVVLSLDDARALLYVLQQFDEIVYFKNLRVYELDENSEQFLFECAQLDHMREQIEVLGEIRRQIWSLDFESEQ